MAQSRRIDIRRGAEALAAFNAIADSDVRLNTLAAVVRLLVTNGSPCCIGDPPKDRR